MTNLVVPKRESCRTGSFPKILSSVPTLSHHITFYQLISTCYHPFAVWRRRRLEAVTRTMVTLLAALLRNLNGKEAHGAVAASDQPKRRGGRRPMWLLLGPRGEGAAGAYPCNKTGKIPEVDPRGSVPAGVSGSVDDQRGGTAGRMPQALRSLCLTRRDRGKRSRRWPCLSLTWGCAGERVRRQL